MDFEPFPKIPRLRRDCTITEKIDGTNAAVVIDGHTVWAQSRKRFITPEADNFGFARWVRDNAEHLVRVLGDGRHFGEWWGQGIQRGYGMTRKQFSLFNPDRYNDLDFAADDFGMGIVPVLYRGPFTDAVVDTAVAMLRDAGSAAARGFMRPEGIVVWHEAARQRFKVTLDNDEAPKGRAA